MTNKLPCRLRAALVVAGCLVPAMALAQIEPHHAPSRTPQRSDIEYGSRTITLPMMQRPPSPAGAPGTPAAEGTPRRRARARFTAGTWFARTWWTSQGPADRRHRRRTTAAGLRHPKAPADRRQPAPVGLLHPKAPAARRQPDPVGLHHQKAPVARRQPDPAGRRRRKAPADRRRPAGGPPKPTAPGMDQPPPGQQAGGGCEPHSPLPGGLPGGPGAGTAVYQQFPPTGPMRTAWFVTFDHAVHRGLFMTSAFFKPGPNRDWIKVLSDAGPSEVFVPYQSGQPRFLDLAHPSEGGAGEFGLIRASQRDAGRCGQVIGRGNAVVREVTEKGVLWKLNQYVYRGHKMTLWGTLGAGNYNYLLSYAFHDDGMIEFRYGATALNLPSSPREAHVHNVIWRVNVDLNGARNNVSVVRHIENTNSPTWRDVIEPFNGNREGSLEWNPREFTTLHVSSSTPEEWQRLAERLHDHADVSRHRAPHGKLDAQGHLGHALQAPGDRLPVHRALRQQRTDRQ